MNTQSPLKFYSKELTIFLDIIKGYWDKYGIYLFVLNSVGN